MSTPPIITPPDGCYVNYDDLRIYRNDNSERWDLVELYACSLNGTGPYSK